MLKIQHYLSILILLFVIVMVTELSFMWMFLIFAVLAIEILVLKFGLYKPAQNEQAIDEDNQWRRKWISTPLLKLFRRITPPMSQTEKEAIDAGSVWWDGELFSGKPRWSKLQKQKIPELSAEEKAYIDGPVDQLCKMIDDWQITHEQCDLPAEVWDYIKSNQFFSMIIPKSYGGLEFSAIAHSSVVMKIATRSISAAVTVMVPNSLGPGKLLLEYGTSEQKDHYIPRLAAGKEVPCFALTNPEAGSDAGAIPDSGIVCRGDFQDQKDVLGMRLNWNKRYITLGPVATLLGLAFKLFDPDHLLGEDEELGVTLALVPTDTPGVSIGRRHLPLNVMFMNGPNSGEDVFLPLSYIIGGQERIGQGWRMLMECLADGRAISLPALSVGSGKLACRVVGAYSRVRTQFKLPIGKFEGVEEALARIGAYTYMMDAARVLTAGALDLGEKPSVISAIVKYHLTEGMRQVVNDSMDVLGGAGICLGPKNMLGRAYQALPISITVEGANILTRSMIIFGQGAIRSHPYIFQELQAADETEWDVSLKKFDLAFFGHMRFFFTNMSRSFFHGITGSLFTVTGMKGPTKKYYKRLSRMSAAFALVADTAIMTLGGNLKRREKLSARLGDVLSQLYLGSAILKHYETQGSIKEDLPLMQWSIEDALHKIQIAIDGFLQNLPNRPAAWWLRFNIFPWGLRYKAPKDQLGSKISQLLISPSDCRDRLTEGMYIPDVKTDAISQLEDALIKVIHAEPIVKTLRKKMKNYQSGYQTIKNNIDTALKNNYISKDEADTILSAEEARWNVIQVDDFTPDLK